MAIKRHTVICREGWFYLTVLGFVVGGALMREINLLLVIAGLMAGPLLYNWKEVVTSLKGLHVHRKLPEGVCAGDLLVVELAMKNARSRSGSRGIVVEDPVARENSRGSADWTCAEVLFTSVPSGQRRQLSYHGRLERRGQYRFGPLRISTRYPLGLIRRTITVDDTRTITVCPRLGRLTPAWSSLHLQTLRGAQPFARPQNALDPEFYGLRDWQNGDSIRSVHWRTSARLGTPVVRQSAQRREQDLLLLVDLWQPAAPRPEDLRHVELAVSFAATVVADLCRRGGSQLNAGLAGTHIRLSRGTASMARLNELMEELAVIEAHTRDRLAELLELRRKEIRPGTTTLLVTTRPVNLSHRAGQGDASGLTQRELAGGPMISIDASSEALSRYFYLD